MNPIELYKSIAESLVEFPDRLRVTYDSESGCILASSDESDCGKLIGVKGQNYKACEDLLQAAAIREGWKQRVFLKIVKQRSKPGFTKRFESKRNWGTQDDWLLRELVHKLALCVLGAVEVSSRNISRDSTNITIRTRERGNDRVNGALSAIVYAIGRNRGRIVFVDFYEPDSNTSRV